MKRYDQIKNLKPLIQKYPHLKNISFLRVYVLIINLMISSKTWLSVRGRSGSRAQGFNEMKVISEVYASFVLQCTVSGR